METSKLIKVTYRQVEIPTEELQQRLDDAFDLLFQETMKTFRLDKPESFETNCNNFIQNNN